MQPTTHTLLIASADPDTRAFLAAHLDADAHTVYDADSSEATIAKLSTHAVDVLLLGDLQRPADSPSLLRAIRAGQHPRVHPAQVVITLGAADELTALRAYEAGSDHHLATSTGYVLLRAALNAVTRRALAEVTSRHLHIGELHIDTASCSAEIAGTPARLSRIEFDLLVKLASDPHKVFSKADLKRAIGRDGRSDRTVDSHVCRLRNRLADAGAQDLVRNRWGSGYALLATE